MAKQEKTLCAKSDDLSLILGTHVVKRYNQLLKVILCLHIQAMVWVTPILIINNNKRWWVGLERWFSH